MEEVLYNVMEKENYKLYIHYDSTFVKIRVSTCTQKNVGNSHQHIFF